jgi:capsular exopolysaccharide synthesis family protein
VLGLLSGLLVGAAGVLFREHTDSNIRSPGDASWYAHVRELGVIPSARIDPGLRGFANGSVSRGSLTNGESKGRQKGSRGNSSVELATWMRKPSLVAESFRGTLASILLSRENGGSPRPHVLVVTSPNPREGKSTVISNLAISLAEIGYRVLLIDADIRRPRLHKIFNQVNNWGLTDLLSSATPVDEYPPGIARDTDVPGIYLLPAGPRAAAPPALFHSDRFPALLKRFRADFDIVLIDTGPILHLAEARMMSRYADGVILVFRARQTSREAAVAAAQRLQEDGSLILGSILNDWDPSTAGYSSYYNSDYYRQYSEEAGSKRKVRVRFRVGHS